MKTIKIKISKSVTMAHNIYDLPINPQSYSALLLLQNEYQDLDISFDPENDWTYLFIVKRTFLRHQRKNGKWICHYCQKEIFKMPERNKNSQNIKNCVTIDHKIPISKCGDKLNSTNFLVSCPKCNNNKASKDYDHYFKLKTI